MKERGLLRSTIAALAGKDIRPVSAERKIKKELALYESHFKSPTVSRLYNDTINRAVGHRMFPYANGIHHIQELDSASLYNWRHSHSWGRQPDSVKAVFEIALAIAKADLKGKARRGYILAVGEGEGKMVSEDDVFHGVGNENGFGMANPDVTVVTDLYKLLGLEGKTEDIPSIPRFNRFVHTDIFRFHVLPEYGVKLRFSFSGSSAGEFEDADKKVPFYPAHIGMTVEAKRTPSK